MKAACIIDMATSIWCWTMPVTECMVPWRRLLACRLDTRVESCAGLAESVEASGHAPRRTTEDENRLAAITWRCFFSQTARNLRVAKHTGRSRLMGSRRFSRESRRGSLRGCATSAGFSSPVAQALSLPTRHSCRVLRPPGGYLRGCVISTGFVGESLKSFSPPRPGGSLRAAPQ